jgi:ubiquinone/menaquinone biosynthesis C-methylase UbiE
MREDYAEVFEAPAVVDKYERVVYAPDSWATVVDRRQRRRLRRWAMRVFPGRLPVQHDFACGTGRALRMFAGIVRHAHGYDVSTEMLARAAGTVPADLHLVTAGEVAQPVGHDGPALVTMFRFLLNAAPPAREDALAFAARVLPDRDAGMLVVENHGPRGSLRGLNRRRRQDDPWFAELSHWDITALLDRHGFQVVRRHGFGVSPAGLYRRAWSRPLAVAADAVAAAVPHAAVATNVVYVARRSS